MAVILTNGFQKIDHICWLIGLSVIPIKWRPMFLVSKSTKHYPDLFCLMFNIFHFFTGLCRSLATSFFWDGCNGLVLLLRRPPRSKFVQIEAERNHPHVVHHTRTSRTKNSVNFCSQEYLKKLFLFNFSLTMNQSFCYLFCCVSDIHLIYVNLVLLTFDHSIFKQFLIIF